ncbi:MAG TPA: serine hydrolase [Actinospica sp.]|jgi:hypothetical protein|nr:serine hydrolase [Actinospica sp.]
MLRKPKLSSLMSNAIGMTLVIGTGLIVVVAIAMALFGPSRGSAAAAAVRVESASPSASAASSAKAGTNLAGADTSSAPASSSASASASPSATPDPSASLASAVSSLVSADDGHVSVAVEDLSSGTTASYNVSDDYVTASIVKLDILETLLYDDQQKGTSPTSSQRSLIIRMIEQSDNDAALDLYDEEGGSSAITAANKVFGLTGTTVDSDAFGDTTTTVNDQLVLLRQAFTGDSSLTSANRGYIQSLMSKVESDQRWGVSAAADDSSSSATDYMLKNGWLPRSATDLWEINSIGEVEHDGHEYLVAVLSADNETMDDGVDTVEKVAKAAVDGLD